MGPLGPGGCRSRMVSDLEANWRAAVARFGPWSPIMNAIGANWGRVGVTRFGPVVSHGLRSRAQLAGLRSPIMSAIGTIGALWVSRASGLWFFPKKELFGALSSEKSATRLARRVARAWVRGLPCSPHERNGAGWVSRGPWFSWFWK